MGLRQLRKHGLSLNGWIVLDKPRGMRSTLAVARVQSLLRARKCGHAGTLDPAAEGLLPLALGAATKTVSYAMESSKVYDMTVRWGERSTTDDSEGEIEEKSEKRPSREEIEQLLPLYTGEILQRPPRFSALRIGGQRAYTLARRGEEVTLAPRKVQIFRLELVDMLDADRARFSVEAGKGAYMRALARDLGAQLGCLGRLENLRRSRVGAFSEQHAVSLDHLERLFERQEVPSEKRAETSSEIPLNEIPLNKDSYHHPSSLSYPPHLAPPLAPPVSPSSDAERTPLSHGETLARLGKMLLPIESALVGKARLVLERYEQQNFCRGQSVLFSNAEQQERLAALPNNQNHVAVFSSPPASRLLGVGLLKQGCLRVERLFVATKQGERRAPVGERYYPRKKVATQRDNL